MKCCHRPSIKLHCTDQRQLKKIKIKIAVYSAGVSLNRPFVMASLALLLLSINCRPHPSASWPNMKVNLCNGHLSGVAGLWFVFLRANREDRHTNTQVPVWAGLFDVFMIRACSLRNCSISDLRSRGKKDKKTIYMTTVRQSVQINERLEATGGRRWQVVNREKCHDDTQRRRSQRKNCLEMKSQVSF